MFLFGSVWVRPPGMARRPLINQTLVSWECSRRSVDAASDVEINRVLNSAILWRRTVPCVVLRCAALRRLVRCERDFSLILAESARCEFIIVMCLCLWRRRQCIIVFGFVWYEPLEYDTYVYPWWANLLGWMMALSSILCMPVLAVTGILWTSGTLREVSFYCFIVEP